MKRLEKWKFPNGQVVEVYDPYYAASCDQCGWQGSSEQCGLDIDCGHGDSEVYCPVCHAAGADSGKAGEAAMLVVP